MVNTESAALNFLPDILRRMHSLLRPGHRNLLPQGNCLSDVCFSNGITNLQGLIDHIPNEVKEIGGVCRCDTSIPIAGSVAGATCGKNIGKKKRAARSGAARYLLPKIQGSCETH